MSKEKIIFLHGALGAAQNFVPLLEICKAEFECTLLDFPGHGNNEMVLEFSIEKLSDYLIDYISAHFTAPVSIFGYSMGGYIALHALTLRPELFNKVMTLATKFHWNEMEASKQLSMLNTEKIEAKIPQFASQLQQLHPAHDWKEVVNRTSQLIQHLGAHPPLDMQILHTLENAVCIGLGDHDSMVTMIETENIYRQLKNGNMYVIPNMQHPIEKMNTTLIYQMMKDFFNC